MATTLIEQNNMNENMTGGDEGVKSYEQLFNKSLLTKKVGVDISELIRNSDRDIQEILENKLKLQYEGLCITEGYVKYDSIRIISYSMGVMNNNTMEYSVVFECHLCCPFSGMKVKCTVKNITKAGLRCVVADLPISASRKREKSPMVIFIARDYYYDNDEFNAIQENQDINVEVIGSRYELNDDYIVVFADLL
jgi:DNA-directed RNA polymerase subunit E'/Rpb7